MRLSTEDRKSRQNKALYAENRDRIGVTEIGVGVTEIGVTRAGVY